MSLSMMDIGKSDDSNHLGRMRIRTRSISKKYSPYISVDQNVTKHVMLILAMCFAAFTGRCTDYFVSASGSDSEGDGSKSKPWKTLQYACTRVQPDLGHTINLSAGTYTELQVVLPTGVTISGAGREHTILKADPSFFHNPPDPGFSHEKFLIMAASNAQATGNQTIKDLTIDGNDKKLHGGILVKNRSHVLLKRLTVQNTNFAGIWLWEVKDSRTTDVSLKNCAWGSAGWSSGALSIANLERVELDHINIDEDFGYGIKALGTNGPMHDLKVHDNRISVTPIGQWKTTSGGDAPNIAFELWNVDLSRCEFFNNYVDNTISLVMDKEQWRTPKNAPTIRLYNNIIDLESRAKGRGYAFEVSIHDVEIDHNYIIKGQHGIVNWDQHGTRMSNWLIHHNIFYGIADDYPAEILRAQHSGLHNVKFYNNTVEFSGTRTTNLVAIYGGESENIEIKNNLLINSNTSYNHYPNEVIHIENGTLSGLDVSNNFLYNQGLGNLNGTSKNNLSGDPKIRKAGRRPLPYYLPEEGSPVIDSGVNVGLPFSGRAPDIGAHETFFK